ncbi:hypothetical protein HAX54_017759, partial [Datura stramonium]|nr:hypothetical protein [Datura stramonium]
VLHVMREGNQLVDHLKNNALEHGDIIQDEDDRANFLFNNFIDIWVMKFRTWEAWLDAFYLCIKLKLGRGKMMLSWTNFNLSSSLKFRPAVGGDYLGYNLDGKKIPTFPGCCGEIGIVDGLNLIDWRYKGSRRFGTHIIWCADDPTHLGNDLALAWLEANCADKAVSLPVVLAQLRDRTNEGRKCVHKARNLSAVRNQLCDRAAEGRECAVKAMSLV